jgi:hypothetical protein
MIWMCNVSYDTMLEYYKNGTVSEVMPPPPENDADNDDVHDGGLGDDDGQHGGDDIGLGSEQLHQGEEGWL